MAKLVWMSVSGALIVAALMTSWNSGYSVGQREAPAYVEQQISLRAEMNRIFDEVPSGRELACDRVFDIITDELADEHRHQYDDFASTGPAD